MKHMLLGMLSLVLLPLALQAGQSVDYTVNGETFQGYYAGAYSGNSKGLVVIIHDWDGLTEYEKQRAEMLAGMDYDAFAVDLFGKGKLPQSIDENREATGRLYNDRARMRALLVGGLKRAQQASSGNAVVMGYCFGGTATLELARSGQASKVVGYTTFHGGLSTPEGQGYSANTPPLLIAHGGADSSITMQDVASLSTELESAGVSYEIQVYSGAPHAFTVFGSDRYRERADKESWAAFTDFLSDRLGHSM